MKTVLITGAGRGLGRAIAKAFYDEGFEVIATDIDTEMFSYIKDKERYTCLKLDVTSEKECSKFAVYIEEKYGQLDVVISNAGMFDFYPVSEAGTEKLKIMFAVNVFGLANLTKHFLAILSRSAGRLIVIGSESFKVPSPFQPYSVSKQSLESVYKAIKIELSLKGVKSIMVRPGAMQTKILEDTLHFSNSIHESQYSKEFDAFIETVPKYIGRIVNPDKVANLVLKAAIARKPKSIYHINHNPVVSLLALLPERYKDYVIKKSLNK